MRKPKDKKLCKAVEDFAAQMLDRLAEKEAKGYTGWDDKRDEAEPRDWELLESMEHDIKCFYGDGQKQSYAEASRKNAIDIANRAMMLWFRAQAKEGE
jgi:hypothetical protein